MEEYLKTFIFYTFKVNENTTSQHTKNFIKNFAVAQNTEMTLVASSSVVRYFRGDCLREWGVLGGGGQRGKI